MRHVLEPVAPIRLIRLATPKTLKRCPGVADPRSRLLYCVTSLGKKTGASILISYNISETIPGVKEYVEQQIFEAVKSLSAEA